MYNISRKSIYDYVYNLIVGAVNGNVYRFGEPQALTESDVRDGFITIRVGDLNDESEFVGEAFGWARVYVEAYIPPRSRGRCDGEKFAYYEDAINEVIRNASQSVEDGYSVEESSVLSADVLETTNADNTFYAFIKSFIVTLN